MRESPCFDLCLPRRQDVATAEPDAVLHLDVTVVLYTVSVRSSKCLFFPSKPVSIISKRLLI